MKNTLITYSNENKNTPAKNYDVNVNHNNNSDSKKIVIPIPKIFIGIRSLDDNEKNINGEFLYAVDPFAENLPLKDIEKNLEITIRLHNNEFNRKLKTTPRQFDTKVYDLKSSASEGREITDLEKQLIEKDRQIAQLNLLLGKRTKKNPKQIPKIQPIGDEGFLKIIENIDKSKDSLYIKATLRIAIYSLYVTGASLNVIRCLTVDVFKNRVVPRVAFPENLTVFCKDKNNFSFEKTIVFDPIYLDYPEGLLKVYTPEKFSKDRSLLCGSKEKDAFLFTQENDSARLISREHLTREITKAIKKALGKDQKLTPHSFRANYVLKLLERGESLEKIARSLSNKSRKSVELYKQDAFCPD